MMRYIKLFTSNEPSQEFYAEYEQDKMQHFGNVNYINLFIGANNSRKSRFLRKLLTEEKYLFLSKRFDFRFKPVCEELRRLFEVNNVTINFSSTLNEENYNNTVEVLKSDEKFDIEKHHTILKSLKVAISSCSNDQSITKNFFEDLIKQIDIDSPSFLEPLPNFNENIKCNLAILEIISLYKSNCANDPALTPFWQYVKVKIKSGSFPVDIMEKMRELITHLKNLKDIKAETITPPKRIYIPIFRTAKTLYRSASPINHQVPEIYKSTISKHYNIIDSDSDKKNMLLEVFTGLALYENIKDDKGKERMIRERLEEFENFLNRNFFRDTKLEITALKDENTLSIYLQDKGDEKHIHHLGDGIQALMVLLYPIFMAEQGTWFFIEEPEMHLHPGLQDLFIQTLLSDQFIKEKELRFFMTTHSNHFLNQASANQNQISVFSFEPTDDPQVSRVKQIIGHDTQILDLLGVFNASVFMANCSIWVEGISDRRYIQAFLKAYLDFKNRNSQDINYQENYHYAFFEYAGSNLSHYIFEDGADQEVEKDIKAYFIANRIFLLADQDEGKDKKHKKLKDLQKENFQYLTTGALEIENVLSSKILKKIVVERLKFTKKTENVKPMREIIDEWNVSEDEYKDKRLGGFLQEKLKELLVNYEIPKLSKNENSTLRVDYKNIFSEFVLDTVKKKEITWEDIQQNPHAKTITESVFNFIENQNKHFKL